MATSGTGETVNIRRTFWIDRPQFRDKSIEIGDDLAGLEVAKCVFRGVEGSRDGPRTGRKDRAVLLGDPGFGEAQGKNQYAALLEGGSGGREVLRRQGIELRAASRRIFQARTKRIDERPRPHASGLPAAGNGHGIAAAVAAFGALYKRCRSRR